MVNVSIPSSRNLRRGYQTWWGGREGGNGERGNGEGERKGGGKGEGGGGGDGTVEWRGGDYMADLQILIIELHEHAHLQYWCSHDDSLGTSRVLSEYEYMQPAGRMRGFS